MSAATSPCPLTASQLDAIAMAARMGSYARAAYELGLTRRTISNHCHHAIQRLRVRSFVTVAVMCVERGWIRDITTEDDK